jgi:hypothetical protein
MTQRGKLIAATVALLAVLAVVTWQALRPTAPPNPLASLDAAGVKSVSFPPALPDPDRQASLAKAVASLKDAPRRSAAGINWAGARYVRVELADGIVLSLQHLGGSARMIADAPANANAATAERVETLRKVRGEALLLDPATVQLFEG